MFNSFLSRIKNGPALVFGSLKVFINDKNIPVKQNKWMIIEDDTSEVTLSIMSTTYSNEIFWET